MHEGSRDKHEEEMIQEGKKLEIDRLDEFKVYDIVPWRADVKNISSTCEVTPKIGPERDEFRRARWLCREFAKGASTMEHFAHRLRMWARGSSTQLSWRTGC